MVTSLDPRLRLAIPSARLLPPNLILATRLMTWPWPTRSRFKVLFYGPRLVRLPPTSVLFKRAAQVIYWEGIWVRLETGIIRWNTHTTHTYTHTHTHTQQTHTHTHTHTRTRTHTHTTDTRSATKKNRYKLKHQKVRGNNRIAMAASFQWLTSWSCFWLLCSKYLNVTLRIVT